MHPMHPMQPYINLYVFSYRSLCIYASHASYAAVYKLVYISHTSLCIYASYASYASVYKLLYISYTSLCIYASMHPMQMIKLVFNSNGLISCLVSFVLMESNSV